MYSCTIRHQSSLCTGLAQAAGYTTHRTALGADTTRAETAGAVAWRRELRAHIELTHDTFVWQELSELSAHTGLHLDDDLPELVEMHALDTFEE